MANTNLGELENSRPDDPTQLLVDRDIPSLWQAKNFKRNRFSVLNLDLVIGQIGLEHTNSKRYFEAAAAEIEAMEWRKLHKFEYHCSHTQVFPNNRSHARQFGHAATTVVALELAADVLEPGYNVYDKLRILPATYFVDLFDRDQLEKARKQIDDFDNVCLEAIGQEFDKKLIYQHCLGMTLTKSVAVRLRDFLGTSGLEVEFGPVRCSGDPEQRSSSLASKNRATELTINPTLEDVPPLG